MGKRVFGSVRKLPSGKWQARYRHPASGELIPAGRTFPTKAEANAWLSGIETDLARGTYVDPLAGDITLRTYADRWLEQRILRPRTVELYRGLLDHHILPVLGDTKLAKLTPQVVRAWHAEKAKAGRPGPVTVAKAYRLLKTICTTAVEDELIPRNPCNIKGAAVERSPERPVLSVAQLQALIDAMEPRYRVTIVLGAWCGLRLGEILALNRSDVDVSAGTVRVDKAACELRNGHRITGPPKTAAGIRVVAIPPHVKPILEWHSSRFAEATNSGYFITGTKGQPLRRATLYTAWARACDRTGLSGTRFHDLRHTGATLAGQTGATTRELMARLGHASAEAALRYQHATHARDGEIARALSRLVDEDETEHQAR